MTDRILIRDLLVRGILGVNEDERINRQDVLINIELEADTRAAGASDDLQDTVNYRTIAKHVIDLVETSSYYLVERLAEEIAGICLGTPGVLAARVRVEKPGALRFARSVGVEIRRARPESASLRHRALVLLGSNIEPERHLHRAVELLDARCRLLAVSSVYESPPIDREGRVDAGQPNYLNAAVLLETELPAEQLKRDVLREIEQRLGRQRSEDKYAARTIDLDIVLYNEKTVDQEGRWASDSHLLTRPYLVYPLAEVAPHVRPLAAGQPLAEIAASLPPAGLARRDDVVLRASGRRP